MRLPGFDSLTLRAIAREASGALTGGRIQRITQHDARTVILRVYRRGETSHLLVSADASLFRAHLTDARPAGIDPPPPFCMALRKHLDGGRVRSARQDGTDRVLRIHVATGAGEFALVCELMGRNSNVILLGPDGMILEAIRHVPPRADRRSVLPGRRLDPLPAPAGLSLWDAPEVDLRAAWNALAEPPTMDGILGAFAGASPYLAERILEEASPLDALLCLARAARESRFQPAIYVDPEGRAVAAWPFPPPGEAAAGCSMSEALQTAARSREEAARRERLTRELTAFLDREERTMARRAGDLEQHRQRADNAEIWRVMGELLSAQAHAVERGAVSVVLPNYYDPALRNLEIPLDPALSARENAGEYFTRHRKARAAAERLPGLEQEIGEGRRELGERREALREADTDGLEALHTAWGVARQAPTRRGRREPEYPPGVRIRRYTSDEGYQILIGENATGNDYLTTRLADPSDIWLHVRAAASAHGVIRASKRPEMVPPATLRRAATLVAARSEARHSSAISVDYTLRRYVRKPRGAAPGLVTYEREKTITVGADDV